MKKISAVLYVGLDCMVGCSLAPRLTWKSHRRVGRGTWLGWMWLWLDISGRQKWYLRPAGGDGRWSGAKGAAACRRRLPGFHHCLALPHLRVDLSLTDNLTDTNQSFPVESEAPQTMGPWLGRGEGTAQAQPPLAAAGKVGRQMVKIGRQVEFGS